jgi:hypothetical protein
VTVIDLAEIVRGEHAESIRKDFAPTEIDAITKALAPLEAAAAKERQAAAGGDKRARLAKVVVAGEKKPARAKTAAAFFELLIV